MSIWAIQIGLGGFFVFFFFSVTGHVPRVEGVALVGIGNECDQGTLYEIPNELI